MSHRCSLKFICCFVVSSFFICWPSILLFAHFRPENSQQIKEILVSGNELVLSFDSDVKMIFPIEIDSNGNFNGQLLYDQLIEKDDSEFSVVFPALKSLTTNLLEGRSNEVFEKVIGERLAANLRILTYYQKHGGLKPVRFVHSFVVFGKLSDKGNDSSKSLEIGWQTTVDFQGLPMESIGNTSSLKKYIRSETQPKTGVQTGVMQWTHGVLSFNEGIVSFNNSCSFYLQGMSD